MADADTEKSKTSTNHRKAVWLMPVWTSLALLVVIGIFLAVKHSLNKVTVIDCNKNYKSTKTLIDDEKYKQAMQKIQAQPKDCQDIVSQLAKTVEAKQGKGASLKDKISAIEYNSALAEAANGSGNRKLANQAANTVITINRNMTTQERAKIPNQQAILISMIDITSESNNNNAN